MQNDNNNKELVNQLFDLGAQFGHRSSKFHPNMNPYVWGVKNGMHLIDLNKTAFLLNYACQQIEEVMASGGQILWIGTKKQAQKGILEAATLLAQPYVIHRWIGGTLTNSDQVKKAITRLLHMRDVVSKPLPHFKKKQISMLQKDLNRLEKNVSGITCLRGKPALLVVVDVKRETTAIKEARKCGIPVVGIVDTNASTEMVDIIIPANDDSQKSVNFILHKLAEAAGKGIARVPQPKIKEKAIVSVDLSAGASVDKVEKASTPFVKAKPSGPYKPRTSGDSKSFNQKEKKEEFKK